MSESIEPIKSIESVERLPDSQVSSLPADRWERIRALFHACVALEPGKASAFLESSCAGDATLRKEVEALLDDARRAAAAGLLDRPTAAVAHRGVDRVLPPSDPDERAGSVIGAYRLLDVLGEGGFGIVYRAQQLEPVRRQVALKIIKLGMDTRQVIQRFEGERQALALMDHPGIARVFDAGATSTGRPFFVMELVEGVPITEHCDRERLAIEERVRLVAEVCRAVQHAHQKGIIHRDIKPSNVLVAGSGAEARPKVIDFGIAKATGSELSERTVLTEFRQLIGTPEYMSPEQAGSPTMDVDTRTDIYSLGVLLYELLAGATPFDSRRLRSGGPGEMQRIVAEEEPPRPSARAAQILRQGGEAALVATAERRGLSPGALLRRLHGDLDWITCKALEKDRARRYATALELANDLERHLTQRPVDARPPSATYRVRKFVRRNRLAVASTAVIAALGTATAVAAANLVGEWERTRELEGRLAAEKARVGDDLDPLEDRLAMARLAATRVDGRFENAPLGQVLEAIAARADVPLSVDWHALGESGVGRETTVTLELDGLRAAAALDAVLGQVASDPLRRPQRAMSHGVVVVSSVDRLSRDTSFAVYDVRDLVAGAGADEVAMGALRTVVTSLIDPESWQDNGGESGRLNALGGSLVAATTRENHRAIRALLAQLRQASGGTPAPVGAAMDVAGASADADESTARRLRSASLSLSAPTTTLGEIVDAVREAAGVPISVDWGGFADTGVSASTPVALHADRLAAGELLRLALAQVSQGLSGGTVLGEEVVDGTVLVASEARLNAVGRIVAYDLAPLGSLAAPAPAGDSEEQGQRWWPLMEVVQSTIEPDGWANNGGNRGRMVALGDRLVVQATPRVQRQVRSLLTSLAGAGQPIADGEAAGRDLAGRMAMLDRLDAVTVALDGQPPLDDVLRAIAKAAGAKLIVDWAALEAVGASPQMPIELALSGLTGRRALDEALRATAGDEVDAIAFDIADDTIVVGAARGDGLPVAVFDVGAILAAIPPAADSSPGEQLASVVTSTISPSRWLQNGGVEGRLHLLGDRLVVSAPTPMIREVERLLDALTR